MADRIELAQLSVKFIGDVDDLAKGVMRVETVVSKSFDKVDKASGKVEKGFNDVDKATQKLDASAVNLAARMQILNQAYGVLKSTIGNAVNMARLGAQSERVQDRFEKFAATIGNSTELLEAFNKGSGNAVDKLTAMNTSALLIQQGLVTTNAEMEKTVEMATRLGDQTLGATSRLEAFGQLLRNQSIRLLDNFGISSGRVRTRILELQKATKGLAREEAFRIAVFEEGQKALDVLGPRLDDNAAAFERAEAKMRDMRVEMGEKLAPAIAKIFNFIADLDVATIAIITTFAAAAGTAIKFAGGLTQLATKLNMSVTSMGAVGLAAVALIGVFEGVKRVLAEVDAGMDSVNETLDIWSEKAQEAADSGITLEDQVTKMIEAADKADEALAISDDPKNLLSDLAKTVVILTQSERLAEEQADAFRKAVFAMSPTVDEANAAFIRWNASVSNSKGLISLLNVEIKRSIAFTHLMADAIDEAKGQARLNAIAVSGTTELIDQQTMSLMRQAVELREAAKGQVRLGEAYAIVSTVLEKGSARLDAVSIALGVATREEVKLRNDVELLSKGLEAGIITWTDFMEAMQLAEMGVLDLSRAEQKLIHEGFNRIKQLEEHEAALEKQKELEEELAEAVEKQTRAIEDQITAKLRQAEALKDADAEKVARAAISELGRAQEAGLITFEDFTKAVVAIQDEFGLADDRSRALTLGLGATIDGLAKGVFAADDMGNALRLMTEDAADGVIEFDRLVERVIAMRDQTEEFFKVVDASRGRGAMETAEPIIGRADIIDAMTGRAVTDGQAANNVPEIIDAMTGQVITPPPPSAAEAAQGRGGMIIYGGLHLEGIQDVDSFLAWIQSLTPT